MADCAKTSKLDANAIHTSTLFKSGTFSRRKSWNLPIARAKWVANKDGDSQYSAIRDRDQDGAGLRRGSLKAFKNTVKNLLFLLRRIALYGF